MGNAAALAYLIIIFLFNEVRLSATMSWRRQRRQLTERFTSMQARRMLVATRRLAGLQYRFDTGAAGTLPPRFILVSNHQSLADIPMLLAAFPRHPLKFVAKHSLQRGIPTLSKSLRYGQHAFIDRRGPFRPTRRALLRLTRMDRQATPNSRFPPCSFAIFPEGTRSRDGRVLPFYRAALRVIAEQVHLPVVAVAVDGGSAIAGLRALRKLGGVHYQIRVLQIYPPPVDRHALAGVLAHARTQIVDQVAAWREGN